MYIVSCLLQTELLVYRQHILNIIPKYEAGVEYCGAFYVKLTGIYQIDISIALMIVN
jgi:hypothetical protein